MVSWYLIVVLTYNSLKTNHVEHFLHVLGGHLSIFFTGRLVSGFYIRLPFQAVNSMTVEELFLLGVLSTKGSHRYVASTSGNNWAE